MSHVPHLSTTIPFPVPRTSDCTCELCELQTRMKRSNPESYQNMATLWNEMMLTSYAFKTG